MEELEVNQLEKWKFFNPFLKLEGKFFQPYWKIGRIKISIQKNFDSLIICFPNHWTLFFDFSGFDGVKDTPVEILHVVLLGFVKYLARDLHENLTESQKEEAAGRLNSFNTEHLNIPPINAKALLTHIKSLVGKEFKILIQAAPFVFFKFLSTKHKEIWTALCQLVPYIFITKIDNMNEYLLRLKSYIRTFIYHTMKATAQWDNKPRFHHLLQLCQ